MDCGQCEDLIHGHYTKYAMLAPKLFTRITTFISKNFSSSHTLYSSQTRNTRCVQKVKIHHVYPDRGIFMLIMGTLPSTLIFYL